MVDDEAVRALEVQLVDWSRRQRGYARWLSRDLHPDLDPATYPLLLLLHRHGAQRVTRLSATLDLDVSTVSRQVDAAVRVGLAQRIPDPSDARARLVGLTDEGGRRLADQQGRQIRRWRAALTSWSTHDIATLTELLRRLGEADMTPDADE
jgi:DNA-binding MarR family transcriptional regulator